MTVLSWDRDKGRSADYDVLEFGFNFRFDDIRAALGLAQLRKLESLNRPRAKIVERYDRLFSEANVGVILPFASLPATKQPSYHIYPIGLPSSAVRDSTAQHLKDCGIQTSIHYPPIHRFSAFTRTNREVQLPITEAFAARELTLPLYPSLTPSQVDQIVTAVRASLLSKPRSQTVQAM
jgi:dTDP-4-amino-4,6-dideoxygalactose transaminase